jgi:hypothetical protein
MPIAMLLKGILIILMMSCNVHEAKYNSYQRERCWRWCTFFSSAFY